MRTCTAVSKTLITLQSRHLQATSPNHKNAALKGHWWSSDKRKGQPSPPERDVINGSMLPRDHPKMRFSYLGEHKYEWDPTEPVRNWELPEKPKPNYGQFNRTRGDPLVWDPTCGYYLTVKNASSVINEDKERMKNHLAEFAEEKEGAIWPKKKELSGVFRLSPLSTSLFSPLVWKFIEKVRYKRDTGMDRAVDIMAEAFQIIKLTQMAEARDNPDAKIELNCNNILSRALLNVSPPVKIIFVQVIKKADGYKPCPVPVNKDDSIEIGIKRFIANAKGKKRGVPVEPQRLAALIIDAYHSRGVLWDALQEDILIAQKYKDMYARFGKVNHGQNTKKTPMYRPQTHLQEIHHVTLPLENDEYSKPPGQPEWSNSDLLDEEDRP